MSETNENLDENLTEEPTLEERVSALETNFATLKTSVDSLNGSLQTIGANVQEISTNLSSIVEDISQIKSEENYELDFTGEEINGVMENAVKVKTDIWNELKNFRIGRINGDTEGAKLKVVSIDTKSKNAKLFFSVHIDGQFNTFPTQTAVIAERSYIMQTSGGDYTIYVTIKGIDHSGEPAALPKGQYHVDYILIEE